MIERDHVYIRVKIADMKNNINARILHFGVNLNKATTGDKPQGVSLNRIVVRSWSYSFPNWIYVELSRVRGFE